MAAPSCGAGSVMRPTPIPGSRCPRFATALLVTALLSLLPGCLMFRRYDMTRIHQDAAAMPRNPVIVIHGFLGSRLKNRHTQESVWGRVMNAIRRGKADDLALPIDRLPLSDDRDDLVPYAICDTVMGVKFYGAILDALRDVGGYSLGDINNPRAGDSMFIYNYDWRRDNVESAVGLGRAIRKIKARLKSPELRFDIVAHSMGGLLAEYYLKYGTVDALDDASEVTYAGAADIGRIVVIGTPHRGTMSAFKILNNGISRTLSPRDIFTMPSVYQLLPADEREHFIDMQGQPLVVNMYDARTWIRSHWSIWSLAPGAEPATPEPLTGWPTAPPPSRTASTFFFCATHGLLPANRGFQDNLFYVLLGDGPRGPTAVPAVHGG